MRSMRRLTTIVTLLLGALALTIPASAASTLAPPGNVSAKAGPGYYVVKWGKVPGTGVTYTVTGGSRATTCVVIDRAACNVPAISTAPVRFRVTASRGMNISRPSAPTRSLATRLVLLVAGQSNAMGYESYAIDPITKVNFFKSPYANGADRLSTITWKMPFVPNTPNGSFAPLATPQRFVSPTGSPQMFGPELGLARRLYRDGVGVVGVVKVAYAGTSLASDWPPAGGNLYGKMIDFVRQQMTRDAASGIVDVLSAAYWYQGESDALDAVMARDYANNLSVFIASLRRDLPFTPRAPVVLVKESLASYIAFRLASGSCGEIGGCLEATARDGLVRTADDTVAATLPDVLTVDSLGLARVTVGIHLSNNAELTIGTLMASATESYLLHLR